MESQEALFEAGSSAGAGGQAGTANEDGHSTSIRFRAFFSVLFSLEAAWAAAFLCWTVVYWLSLPLSYSQLLFSGGWQSIFRLARQTDLPRFALYLGFIAIVGITLGLAGYFTARSRRGVEGTWGVRVVRAALWSQPVLIVLIVESALVVNYNLWLANLAGVSTPIFPKVAVVATVLVAVVLVLWRERGSRAGGR